MVKLLSVLVSALLGLAVAAFAAWGIVSANTAAPSHNPAGNQVVDYGDH